MSRIFKELFATFTQTDNVKLLNETLPLDIYYGRDPSGRLCLAFTTPFSSQLPKGTKMLDFLQVKIGKEYWTYVCLNDEEAKNVFYALCDDIVDSIRAISDQRMAFQVIMDRLRIWKRMFSARSGILSEKAIQGLYGELYFLDNYLIPKVGKERAVKAWGGPLGMSKDYSIGLDWYEIKCASAMEPSVTISSHEQLLSDNPGHLVVVKTEKMAEGFSNGIETINMLFEKIKACLADMPELFDSFMEKLNRVGYAPEDAYEQYKFKVVSMKFYLVDNSFPRLTCPTDFGSAIAAISYKLLLNALSKYEEND